MDTANMAANTIHTPTQETKQAPTFWEMITKHQSDSLEKLISLLNEHGIRFCVIDGQVVSASAEPLISLDLDLVVAVDQWEQVEALLEPHFYLERFPNRLNIAMPGSELRIQIRTDEWYSSFVERAEARTALGMRLPVACVEDVLQGKIWSVLDPERRASKRLKDLADIARILEKHPDLRSQVPQEIHARL